VIQASHYLFTLAECCHGQHCAQTNLYIREAMRAAIEMLGANRDQRCILCDTAVAGMPSYLSLILPLEDGWTPLYGGLCFECGTSHERPWLQRQVEMRAHLAFGEVAGSA